MKARAAGAVVAAALAFAASAAGTTAPSDRSVSRACGTITVALGGNDFSYRIRVVSGSVTCIAARRAMRTFVARATRPRGWFCARGHGSDAWAASCARLSPKALVRAYLIAG